MLYVWYTIKEKEINFVRYECEWAVLARTLIRSLTCFECGHVWSLHLGITVTALLSA